MTLLRVEYKCLFRFISVVSGCKLAGEWQADAVGDLPNSGFEGLAIGGGFGPQPLVFDFPPAGFDFVEVGAAGRQVEKGHA